MKILSLKDTYEVDWTDDQNCKLKVKFSDGTKKNISDYGMIGTLILVIFYQFMSELRKF